MNTKTRTQPKGQGEPESHDKFTGICPNCGQYQHLQGVGKHYDCLNACVSNGLAPKVTLASREQMAAFNARIAARTAEKAAPASNGARSQMVGASEVSLRTRIENCEEYIERITQERDDLEAQNKALWESRERLLEAYAMMKAREQQ
jgi:hypothetical protein